MSFNRLAALAGFIVIVLLVLNAALLGDQPTLDDSIEDVVQYIGEDQALHRLAAVLGLLDLPFYIVFIAAIVAKLRDGDREHGEAWAIAALAGAVFIGVTATIGESLNLILFLRGGEGLDDSTVRAIYDGSAVAYGSIGIAVAGVTGSVAIAAIRREFWPRWYGWLSALVAVIGVISVGGVAWTSTAGLLLGIAPFVGLLVWTLASSILLYRDEHDANGAGA